MSFCLIVHPGLEVTEDFSVCHSFFLILLCCLSAVRLISSSLMAKCALVLMVWSAHPARDIYRVKAVIHMWKDTWHRSKELPLCVIQYIEHLFNIHTSAKWINVNFMGKILCCPNCWTEDFLWVCSPNIKTSLLLNLHGVRHKRKLFKKNHSIARNHYLLI